MAIRPEEYELIDGARIEEIASRLELRPPNREALEHIALALKEHYEIEERPAPLEAVVDAATGVGKTFIMAGAIEYLATQGVRNFAVVTPGRTILEKTVGNFSVGHRRSLLDGMDVRPLVVTSENFDSATMAHDFDDPLKVKLFVFTVQSLTKPSTKQGKRTHEFREGLGQAFYKHLNNLEDLVIFADEHHCYYGPAFSAAIRGLTPMALIGLTATPDKRSENQIIFRYPLSAAIADELVKAPVLVGRKDDRSDAQTKLLDGIHLLEVKEQAMNSYAEAHDVKAVQPVMLVVAQTIEDANTYGALVESKGFLGGHYAGHVLVVHSSAPDEALEALDKVEDESSPVRIIISVGMLKEGWDVKNVYVICSMRASVSEVLTEQTLGRGLRLPFGAYTGIEILDTLEVVAHERYDELLRKKAVINEAFIDQRTRAVLKKKADGSLTVVFETTQIEIPVEIAGVESAQGQATITSVEERQKQIEHDVKAVVELLPRAGFDPARLPRLVMTKVESTFSLADIRDIKAFKEKGERLAEDPDEELRRTVVTAEIRTNADGIRTTVLKTASGADNIEAAQLRLPLGDLREYVEDAVVLANATPGRPNEIKAAQPLIDAFFAGLGDKAQDVLSANLARATASLIELVASEQRRFASKPNYTEVVELVELPEKRQGRVEVSGDSRGAFKRSVGYTGWKKSRFEQEWFDSSTERGLAHLLDDAKEIVAWVRLQRGDLPILFSDKSFYHPDFIAVEKDGTHWVVETKADRDMETDAVKEKREAADRWASHVNASDMVGATRWRYLLVSEADLATVKESWSALKRLAG